MVHAVILTFKRIAKRQFVCFERGKLPAKGQTVITGEHDTSLPQALILLKDRVWARNRVICAPYR